MRLRARADANQDEIVKALRAIGCSVLPMHSLGHGAPDIAVGRCGITLFMEIKDGSLKPARQALTTLEKMFSGLWRGHYSVVHNVAEALEEVRRHG